MPIQTNLDSKKVEAQTREYRLPSGGIPYRAKHPDFPGTVVVSPFSFETQGILTTNLNLFQKYRLLVSRIVGNFPAGFDYGDLLVEDAVMVLVLARGLTYGEHYPFTTTCPECGKLEKHEVKVPDSLPVRNWDDADAAALEKRCVVTLPRCRDKVGIRMLSLSEEESIYSSMKATRKQLSDASAAAVGTVGNDSVTTIARQIRTVNGGTPDSVAEAAAYVRRITGADMVALQDALKAFSCGIDFSWTITCPDCGHQYPHAMARSMEFFRRYGA